MRCDRGILRWHPSSVGSGTQLTGLVDEIETEILLLKWRGPTSGTELTGLVDEIETEILL